MITTPTLNIDNAARSRPAARHGHPAGEEQEQGQLCQTERQQEQADPAEGKENEPVRGANLASGRWHAHGPLRQDVDDAGAHFFRADAGAAGGDVFGAVALIEDGVDGRFERSCLLLEIKRVPQE